MFHKIACLASLMTLSLSAFAQVSTAPTLINFQGRLATPSGNPIANGTYSIRFSLWNAATAGTEKWNQTITNITVKNGTFAVLLDTNTVGLFDGNLWLEIKVGTDAPLAPRQQLVSVAYAIKANSVADGKITGASIASGSITTDKFAANIFNPLAWLLGGNSATNPAVQFIGTLDNQPLRLRVNNRRSMRYSYAENPASQYRSINVLGGSEINSIGTSVVGATISGGGQDSFNETDYPNRVLADFGTIGGGYANTASGYWSTVGGGNNTASASYSIVAGGKVNTASGYISTVAGGIFNTASEQYAIVGGGYANTASGLWSTVGGGLFNIASGNNATIAGGGVNGGGNIANGYTATVGGGAGNTASGNYSFAAGQQAQAHHDGSFVWNDASDIGYQHFFASTAANQFNVRASGGVRFFSNSAATTGVLLAAGSGSWSSASDRHLKTNFLPVNGVEVLEQLLSVPISTWNYKANTAIRHIGVMAQDFYVAFGGLGLDEKHIDTIDADGVAFAAIQGLNRKLEAGNAELKKQLAKLEDDKAELHATLKRVADRLSAVEAEQRKQKQ